MKSFKANFKEVDGELVGQIYCDDITLYFEALAEMVDQLTKMNGSTPQDVFQDIYNVMYTRKMRG